MIRPIHKRIIHCKGNLYSECAKVLCVCVHVGVYVSACVHECVHAFARACACVCVCVHACVCV